MSKKPHRWERSKHYDRRGRLAYYCPDCGAVCLVEETEFKDLLDQKGCSNFNRDEDEIYLIQIEKDGEMMPYAGVQTIATAIEFASYGVDDFGDAEICMPDGKPFPLDLYIDLL